MGEVLATFESILAAFHGLDKAGFLLEIARQHILHQVVGIPALLGGRVREFRFQFPGDMYFHFVGSFSENTLLCHRAGLPGRRADNLRVGVLVKYNEHRPRNALRYPLTPMGLEA
jgi:hypothetical protein